MPANANSSHNYPPIDAVITWVNGDDPVLRLKRAQFLDPDHQKHYHETQATRFASANEIKYCVLSICKFAPFIRNIFIITDGQDPGIDEDVEKHFPGRSSSIRIVDHKEIFRNYEEYLPTFNSISIEHMMWRIKGLSDVFVYFNDDFFLIRPVRSEDWVLNKQVVLRGKWMPGAQPRIIWDNFRKFVNRKLCKQKQFKPRHSFHVTQWLSASMLGFKCWFFASGHAPYVLNKQAIKDFYVKNDALLRKNISFRFRDYMQFNIASLSNHLEIINNNRNKRKPGLMYMQPHKRKRGYVEKKIFLMENNPHIKFLCVQSLDLCTEHDQRKIFQWLEEKLGITA